MSIVELVVVDAVEGVGEVAERIFRLLLHHHVRYFCGLADGDVTDELIVEVAEGVVVDVLMGGKNENLIKKCSRARICQHFYAI
jgi:hypothetical protein